MVGCETNETKSILKRKGKVNKKILIGIPLFLCN